MAPGPITGQSEPIDLGQVLISQGLVTEEAVRECLQIQRESEGSGRESSPRLGELLVRRGHVTEKQVVDALATQQKQILYCPRCDVQVNVVARDDVRKYKCARCEGTLVAPGDAKDLKVVDSSIIFISKDPIPKEVVEAAKDPARRFGKYIVINEIGRGAVGVIHRAWDTYLNQYVALKMIKPPPELMGGDRNSWHETRVLSLFKEARSAVRLRHPNIVPIYDVGRVNKDFFISMEYLEGATLTEHIKKGRDEGAVSPFYEEPKKYLRIVCDLARALHYAHTRPSPIVHCDLKPSNVFIDRAGRGYVLDFGLAKDLRAVQPEQPGTVRGTPAYMAPEQASGQSDNIDPRTDVYALGAMLYELLAGRPPFIGDTMDLLRQAIREKPLRPSEVVSYPSGGEQKEGTTSRLVKVPPELESICLRCLEKDRERRFASAKDVFEALDELLKGSGLRKRTAGLTTVKPNRIIVLPPEPREDDAAAFEEPRPAVARDVPSAIVASTAPAPRTQSSGLAWAAAGALTMAGALAIGWFAIRAGTDPEWQRAVRQIDVEIAAFRPELAGRIVRESVAAAPLAQEALQSARADAEWVERLRRRVTGGLNGSKPHLAELRLRGSTLTDVQLVRAGETGLSLTVAGKSVETAWSDIAPDQLLALARAALGSPTPADRYALGVYLAKNDRSDAAREEFAALAGTDLEIAARRYLEQLAR